MKKRIILGADPWGYYWVDKATCLDGGLMDIGHINWLNPLRPQVQVSQPGSGSRVRVALTWKGRVVTDREMTWIE